MKRAITVLTVVLAILLCFTYLFNSHRAILKLATGTSHLIYPPLNTEVTVDGVLCKDAKCFKKGSQVFLWLPKDRVFIIDLQSRDVGIPDANHMYYDLIFGRCLVQTEGTVVSVNDGVKGPGINMDFKMSKDEISFNIPSDMERKDVERVRIIKKESSL